MIEYRAKSKRHRRHIFSRKQIIFESGPPVIVISYHTQTIFDKISLVERLFCKYSITTQWRFFHDDPIVIHDLVYFII
ncbi:hypothetical protein NY2A_b815R [Paramecium bursaria Chlorella virus NY2A]|uniref:Uncharacterized protein b815R n=1 Tax=Paramecium bursaria Chlorella virus NY2A TaxID=46021 RepID=A7IXZ0_PBCVN|nr:hypothetical protein NY2A_b815R [Paramecium bursaria Chlorella virus NY2A]ABT15214.1 hypothetical protein NY2A_b815R [Paramecium bursaria Chlorella virus NY2A]